MKNVIALARTTEQSVDALLKTIRIPPRPSLLAEVQQELSAPEPEPRRLAKIIANDVGLAGSLMKLANSSFFGLRLKATSVDHAVDLLGMEQCGILMTGIIARQSIVVQGQSLEKFWDFSTKRAQAMMYLARHLRVCQPDIAHTFGLFCDIGVPIMLERFPNYATTLAKANKEFIKKFTDVEDEAHQCNHAAVGSLMSRTWGLPEEVSTAILLHHDYLVLEDGATQELIRSLVAMALMSEYGIQKYHGQELSSEWEKGGELACHFLGLSLDEAADRFDELHEMFNHLG